MHGQRHLMTFRHIYEAVPKWEKHVFVKYCVGIARLMVSVPTAPWSRHTYTQSVLYHLQTFHDSVPWWESLKLYVETEFFATFVRALSAHRYCIHTGVRTPALWCGVCCKGDTRLFGLE
jgi:hypothetical protein